MKIQNKGRVLTSALVQFFCAKNASSREEEKNNTPSNSGLEKFDDRLSFRNSDTVGIREMTDIRKPKWGRVEKVIMMLLVVAVIITFCCVIVQNEKNREFLDYKHPASR